MKIKNRKIYILLSLFIGLFSGFVNGLFGSGGGTIVVPSLVFVLGFAQYKAHATALFIILPLSILSSLIYMLNQSINYPITLKISLGAMVGGYIGAKILNRIPNIYLKKIFGTFMIIAAIRMVF